MVNSWVNTTVGELVKSGEVSIFTGPFGSQLHAHDYEPVGIPVIPTEAIGRRRLKVDNIPHISPETAKRLERYRIRQGDILFARRGVQATGLSAIAGVEHDGWICGTGAIVLRIYSKEIDPTFLSFLLSANISIDWLKAHAVGAVMPNLNSGVLERLPLNLPPISEQKAIAHILGTLDDKIELNQQMNRTLEGIARALFKSWFIDFDPVRAKLDGRQPAGMDAETAALFPAEFEDSAIGKIPKGWKVVPLPEAIEVNPTRSLSKGKNAPYLDMKNMPTQGHRPDGWIYREFGSGTKFIQGDTLLARITPCLENGKTAFVDFLHDGEVGWGSTEYIIFRPKAPLPVEFGYFLARSDELRNHAIVNMTGSSGRQRVPVDCFSSYLLAVPSDSIARRFGQAVVPFMKIIKANSEQNSFLISIRDVLSPNLLSGRVCICEVEEV